MNSNEYCSPFPDAHADDAEIMRYGGLLDTLGIGLLSHSADTALSFRNTTARKLLGDGHARPVWLDEDEPVPVGHAELPLHETLLSEVLRSAHPVLGRVAALAVGDGQSTWLKVNAFPVFAQNGGIRGALLTLIDISEQRSLQNKIEQLSTHDPLTGVYNERHVMHLLDNEIHRARRYGTHFTLAQIDVDRFLPLCADHGQRVGDIILAGIGKLLNESLREIDFSGRIGTDEFLLILSNVGLHDAMVGLERLRVLVETSVFTSNELRVTISGGITEFTGENSEALVARSKSLLLHARDAGRNRFCLDGDIL